MLLHKSNTAPNRHIVIDYIRKQKEANPEYKVIDLGGAENPWCLGLVDYYVDIQPVADKKCIVGDIHESETWLKIAKINPDFCICTHVLEDIRDPGFVVSQINRHFKAGFIAVPSKYVELSYGIQSWFFPGYGHHRWIFSLTNNNTLLAIAKFPVSICLNKRSWMAMLAAKSTFLRKVFLKLKLYPTAERMSWYSKPKDKSSELAFLFEGAIDFRYINNDYAGREKSEMLNLYCELSEGL